MCWRFYPHRIDDGKWQCHFFPSIWNGTHGIRTHRNSQLFFISTFISSHHFDDRAIEQSTDTDTATAPRTFTFPNWSRKLKIERRSLVPVTVSFDFLFYARQFWFLLSPTVPFHRIENSLETQTHQRLNQKLLQFNQLAKMQKWIFKFVFTHCNRKCIVLHDYVRTTKWRKYFQKPKIEGEIVCAVCTIVVAAIDCQHRQRDREW